MKEVDLVDRVTVFHAAEESEPHQQEGSGSEEKAQKAQASSCTGKTWLAMDETKKRGEKLLERGIMCSFSI